MNNFVKECVNKLYNQYGDDVSETVILMPGRRATSFFKLELSELLNNRPIWQPTFTSLGAICESVAGLKKIDNIRIITHLYKVYSQFHKETFDQFYHWGEIMLADFDTIDNYMIDAKLLFSNIEDIKDIDSRFDYLSNEQKEIITKFWGTFNRGKRDDSAVQKKFISLWNTLYEIYSQLKTELENDGYGYGGMINRKCADMIIAHNSDLINIDTSLRYAVIGFNALTKCEKTVLDYLKERCDTLFMWDIDNSFLEDKNHEASLFIRENIIRYGDDLSGIERDNFVKPKQITITSTPSEAISCKYVSNILNEIEKKDGNIGKETVIVLANESLLIPILYSIPDTIENINVTSGYPLKLTPVYTLIEYIVSLHRNKTERNSSFYFYHKDIYNILRHPYIIKSLTSDQTNHIDIMLAGIEAGSIAYISEQDIPKGDIFSLIFNNFENYTQFSDKIETLFDYIMCNEESMLPVEQLEFLFKGKQIISSLRITLENCCIDIGVPIYLSLVKKYMGLSRITFEGEPLIGLQVMGILETRNVDFKNVIIVSINEDNFPSSIEGASLIPSNLRYGYGLPTITNHEAMYAYYFYRLIGRATRVDLIYCSASEGIKSGEPSRFIHQLKLESIHGKDIISKSISLMINTQHKNDIVVEKSGDIANKILDICRGKKTLSATSLHEYIMCPIKFYFNTIVGIKEEEEVSEELEAMQSGNITHKILENIYAKFLGWADIKSQLKIILESSYIEDNVNNLISDTISIKISEFNGRIKSEALTISRYIRNIITYDINKRGNFETRSVEYPLTVDYNIGNHNFKFYGIIDRIDSDEDGNNIIIDYKRSMSKLSCDSIEDIFSEDNSSPSKPMFQSLLYCELIKRHRGIYCKPNIYFAKDIINKDYSPDLYINKEKLISYSNIESEFVKNLNIVLENIADLTTPFRRTTKIERCKYCPYKQLCE